MLNAEAGAPIRRFGGLRTITAASVVILAGIGVLAWLPTGESDGERVPGFLPSTEAQTDAATSPREAAEEVPEAPEEISEEILELCRFGITPKHPWHARDRRSAALAKKVRKRTASPEDFDEMRRLLEEWPLDAFLQCEKPSIGALVSIWNLIKHVGRPEHRAFLEAYFDDEDERRSNWSKRAAKIFDARLAAEAEAEAEADGVGGGHGAGGVPFRD